VPSFGNHDVIFFNSIHKIRKKKSNTNWAFERWRGRGNRVMEGTRRELLLKFFVNKYNIYYFYSIDFSLLYKNKN